ncbi:hypothetical protein CLTEP_24690 [Clostridium tepidiprofundi DSM 19306]|uniref:Uncharacterized protein n=1 Tax=Clostridium tepidiprofundi DSM 19306 TaxID=1121338 RepID=A0A151AU52_9CLOT|nr:hypothetical protein CLTEP_24690 [Clostridium tepidiprofundi DSM 19306]
MYIYVLYSTIDHILSNIDDIDVIILYNRNFI